MNITLFCLTIICPKTSFKIIHTICFRNIWLVYQQFTLFPKIWILKFPVNTDFITSLEMLIWRQIKLMCTISYLEIVYGIFVVFKKHFNIRINVTTSFSISHGSLYGDWNAIWKYHCLCLQCTTHHRHCLRHVGVDMQLFCSLDKRKMK